MKAPNPSDNDRQLSELLHEWKPQASLPPRFHERVWKQIDRAETMKSPSTVLAVARWIEATFRRPVLATAYYWQAQGKQAQTESKMRALYVQSVDPYQGPRN